MSGLLHRGCRKNRSRHSWRICNPHFYVSGKKPTSPGSHWWGYYPGTLSWSEVSATYLPRSDTRRWKCCPGQLKTRLTTNGIFWVATDLSQWLYSLSATIRSHDLLKVWDMGYESFCHSENSQASINCQSCRLHISSNLLVVLPYLLWNLVKAVLFVSSSQLYEWAMAKPVLGRASYDRNCFVERSWHWCNYQRSDT